MTLKRILAVVHLALAIAYLVFVTVGPWAKRSADEGVFSADGGTGFGILAFVMGLVLLALAVMRLLDRSRVLPGLGVEQLTVIVGIAATLNLIAFIVGWLKTFEAGTGWGVVAAYFPASLIPQLGLLTLSATTPDAGVRPLAEGPRRVYSLAALAGGVAVFAFPFLTWLSDPSLSLSAMDGRSSNDFGVSGPRFGYILLLVGLVVIVAAAMRLRPQGLAEPGANLLHSHALTAAGTIALVIPLATLISVFRIDLPLDAGIGAWLALLAGVALLVIATLESRTRSSAGT